MNIDKIKIIRRCLEKDKTELYKAISDAAEARDAAPSAMESHHDTTRNQEEKLVFALEEKLNKIKNLINNLPPDIPDNLSSIGIWSYVELTGDKTDLKLILVPEGYGGETIDEIILVSISTPLGKSLLNKEVNNIIEINNQSSVIVDIQ